VFIDAQRVAALAKLPRRGRQGSGSFDPAKVTQVLGLCGRMDDRLGRPVAWSSAACVNRTGGDDGSGPEITRDEARTVCVRCPIREDCATALMAGAPAVVRQWRERVDGGRTLGD
jgi:hypothetical protein